MSLVRQRFPLEGSQMLKRVGDESSNSGLTIFTIPRISCPGSVVAIRILLSTEAQSTLVCFTRKFAERPSIDRQINSFGSKSQNRDDLERAI